MVKALKINKCKEVCVWCGQVKKGKKIEAYQCLFRFVSLKNYAFEQIKRG